jgi:hypothetical protein
MKKILVLLLALCFSMVAFSQTMKYSRVKIYTDDNGLLQLAKQGLDVTNGDIRKGVCFVSEFSEREIGIIRNCGLAFDILIDDVSKYYVERNMEYAGLKIVRDLSDDYPVPEGWQYGSMGGFYTNEEMLAELDTMYMLYPDLITEKEQIGITYEGMPVYAVKISDNPGINEEEPEVLYTGIHHAREPITVQLLIYYMYYLLENYDTDTVIRDLVDYTEMYFIPIINVDGYIYNETINPNGGGMWRKTRRDNGGGSYGVDPNRNYEFMWGYDNIGSSPDPWDNTYRGPEPFSELCVQAVRDYCIDYEFGITLNYHSYSNLLLFPWGYDYITCPDEDIFTAYGNFMTQDNNYTVQQGVYLYPTNGGSDDWMYGEQYTKNKIFSYTPEVGSSGDGFWPTLYRIIPLCQENMIQNIYAARFVGKYALVTDISPAIIEELSGNLDFEIQRLGLIDEGVFTVSIIPLGDEFNSVGYPVEFTGLDILEIQSGSISYTLNENIQSGEQFSYVLSVDNGDYAVSDTIIKIFGEPIIIFEDNGNTFDKWSSNKWNVTTGKYHSPTGSITDSPYGNYISNETNHITLDEEIDLTDAQFAVLNFWATWEIEQGWDYVQLKISTNGGATWIPLAGEYTVIGNNNQATGEPLYDGFRTNWVQEEILLEDFIGEMIKLRFTLVSDNYVNEDGYYFDDMTVTIVNNPTSVEEPGSVTNFYVSEPYPNPLNHCLHFEYNLQQGLNETNLYIFNAAGQKMIEYELPGDHGSVRLNVSGLESGVYYFIIKNHEFATEARKFIKY